MGTFSREISGHGGMMMGDRNNHYAQQRITGPGPDPGGAPLLDTILTLNRLIATTEDEDQLIQRALQLLTDQAAAEGAAYVPLDSNALPLEASFYGKQPAEDLKEWVEYLASPRVHGQCRSCQSRQAVDSCPLLVEPLADQFRLYCFPLRLGAQEYGLITLFRGPSDPLSEDSQGWIQLAADQLTLGLENLHLRTREERARIQIPSVEEQDSLEPLIEGELDHIRAVLGADFAHLLIHSSGNGRRLNFHSGGYPGRGPGAVQALGGQVLESGRKIVSLKGKGEGELSLLADHDLMAAPLPLQAGGHAGVLLVGRKDLPGFLTAQVQVFERLVQHCALVIQNLFFLQEVKIQAVLEERTRLAREIHDGLAQTLGYLKLHSTQLKRALEQDQLEDLAGMLERHQQVISGAYEDARESIDGLQVDPAAENFSSWVNQMVEIFAQSSGWNRVRVDLDDQLAPPPEVQVQLIRIVQEAFSNIRKHAEASTVRIAGRTDRDGLVMEIRDDGRGFSLEEAGSLSHHGLQGMRERASLIAADLTLESSPGAGTAVRVSWYPDQEGELDHAS
jgi:two-component system nitrate/nitrite sensor histidine kinase NarX